MRAAHDNFVVLKLLVAMSEETRKVSEVTGDKMMTKMLIDNVSKNSNGLFWICKRDKIGFGNCEECHKPGPLEHLCGHCNDGVSRFLPHGIRCLGKNVIVDPIAVAKFWDGNFPSISWLKEDVKHIPTTDKTKGELEFTVETFAMRMTWIPQNQRASRFRQATRSTIKLHSEEIEEKLVHARGTQFP